MKIVIRVWTVRSCSDLSYLLFLLSSSCCFSSRLLAVSHIIYLLFLISSTCCSYSRVLAVPPLSACFVYFVDVPYYSNINKHKVSKNKFIYIYVFELGLDFAVISVSDGSLIRLVGIRWSMSRSPMGLLSGMSVSLSGRSVSNSSLVIIIFL